MPTRKKASESDELFYVPFERYREVSYIEDGAPQDAKPFVITIRSNLTVEEVEELRLSEGATNAEMWELIAPHIVKWPFRDREGNAIDPPSVGGGQQFRKVPAGLGNLLYRDLFRVNLGRVDPKS